MIDEDSGDRLRLRDERLVSGSGYLPRHRWVLACVGLLLLGGILIHVVTQSLIGGSRPVTNEALISDEKDLAQDNAGLTPTTSLAIFSVPGGSAQREVWPEALAANYQRPGAIHWTGAAVKVNDSWPSQLILHSPIQTDTDIVLLTRQQIDDDVRPPDTTWEWPDLCDVERQKAGSSDKRVLQLNALGPAADLVKAVPQAMRPCIGNSYLRFFKSSMTFKYRNTLQYSDPSRLHWLVDTDFASYSNLTVPPYFTYISEPEDACPSTNEVTVLILTYCHPKDSVVRRILRNYLPMPADVRRVFVVGRPMKKTGYMTRCDWKTCEEDHSHDDALLAEQEKYQDLVWVNFTETYQNLTMKTASAFQWARTRCPQAKFVYKMDKDLYANYGRLKEYLTEKLADKHRYTWLGTCMTYAPLRKNARNTVTWDEWPSTYFPNYASGVGYAYAHSMLRHQLLGIYRIPIPPIEDMYMGTVNTALGFKCESGPSWSNPPSQDKFALCNKVLTTWEVSSDDITIAYEDGKFNRALMPHILQLWATCAANNKV